MQPYLAPGLSPTLRMELIGIITHQGTNAQGHYVAITRKGKEWFSYNDAIVTRVTVAALLQTQAYILIFRRMDQEGDTTTHRPRTPILSQHPTNKKPKLSHMTEPGLLESPTPGSRGKLLDQNIPYQHICSGGDIPQPGPIYGEGLRTVNLEVLDTPPTTRPDSHNPATRGEVEGKEQNCLWS